MQINHTDDDLEFQEDMDYIRSLGAAMLEHAADRLSWPPEATIFARLKADVAPDVRRAVFAGWATTQQLWKGACAETWAAAWA